MWVEMMSFILVVLKSLYLYLQPPAQTFFGVLVSIFKCLHEQFSQYFKFNFSEIKLLLPASSPNLLPLLPQPPTPNLFLLQIPLSKLMAILSILPKLWDTSHPWPKLFPPLPHAIPCLFLYLKHIFNLSFLFLYLLIHHHSTSSKLQGLPQASSLVFLLPYWPVAILHLKMEWNL